MLFPQRIDEDIAEDDPVRVVDAVVESLNIEVFKKLYRERGCGPYNPKMLLKVVLYACMDNVHSCRKIGKRLPRGIHFMWLSGYNKPDFITINRFRNRVKNEIDNIFTQLALILAGKGFVGLDVGHIDGTKMESKANRHTFVWRKTVGKNRARLMERISVLLSQTDDAIAQDNVPETEKVGFTPGLLTGIIGELKPSLEQSPVPKDKERKRQLRVRKKRTRELEAQRGRLSEYDGRLGQMKSNMACRRFRHFGKDKATMDFAFFAIAFNIKKMCSKMGKQTKIGGNTPQNGLFFFILQILPPGNRIFWRNHQKSVA